ncbi:MAG: argininosuccinate lyase [Candidatus Omnitrophota bacterium]
MKLWGSRFAKRTDASVHEFTSSIDYDSKLAEYDIEGSIAHARMLGKTGIIEKRDSDKLVAGLKYLRNSLKKGTLKFSKSKYEDIHSAVTGLLEKKIGKVAQERLHTARSRNDQVSLDMRMYCKDNIDMLVGLLTELQKAILDFSKDNIDVIIPAYTHMQHAQCILMSHQMLAYVEMIERDKDRLRESRVRTDEMPLGSGALRGTSLNIDRKMVAKELGFAKISRNSIDAISDRDFIMEILSALMILGIHLSRFAEDMILWSTKEFSFIELDDSFATGSSMMPNKKNPDVLELIRGLSGTFYANLSSVTVMMKGLPLSYNRDLQLDKEPLFNSIEILQEILPLTARLIKGLKINKENARKKVVENEFLFATDIAEMLVMKGHSYRDAHDITGAIIKHCIKHDANISSLSDTKLKTFSSFLTARMVKKLLDPDRSIASVKSLGGTNSDMVREAINNWKNKLNYA